MRSTSDGVGGQTRARLRAPATIVNATEQDDQLPAWISSGGGRQDVAVVDGRWPLAQPSLVSWLGNRGRDG